MAALAGVLVATATPAAAVAAVRLDLGSHHVADPSAGPAGVLAWDEVAGGVLQGKLRVNGVINDLPGKTPDVDGTRVVVDTGSEFEIVDTGSLAVLRTLQLKGTEPALFDHWLVYRRVTTRRHLILYDLSTNQSRVIATVKMRSDLGEPDISGRRVVFSVTGQGPELDQGLPVGRPDDAQGPPDPDLVIQPRVDQRDDRDVCAPGLERRGGVAPRPREPEDSAGLPDRRGHGPRAVVDGHGSVVHLLHGLHEVGVAHLACLRRGNRASDVG